ncbi:MAG: hypothetical protein RJQ09_00170 [Cyclobacteriaceae bacterium]
MFTEYEVELMVGNPAIKDATFELRKDFIKTEAPYLEIMDEDFFSLVLMAPTVGIALANGSVSLFEELALNKKARKLSKGGYFLKKDPVVYAMKYLIKNYTVWEDKFFGVIKLAMKETFDIEGMKKASVPEIDFDAAEYNWAIMNTPYIFVRFISAFFLSDDEDIINQRSMVLKDYEKMLDIGHKMDLDRIPAFQMFTKTFKVK